MKGLQKIVSLKASINLGLNDELKAAFPDTVPAVRYLAESTKILAKAKSWVNYEIPLTTNFFFVHLHVNVQKKN